MNTENLWLNFTNINNFDENPFVINKAEGSYVYANNGNKYVDAISGIWNVSLGYSRIDIINRITSALNYLPATALFGRTYPDLIDYSNRLISKLPEFDRVFFGTGGSDSVETALKAAQNYWYLKGLKQKKKIGHFNYSYHGVSLGTMNVMGERPNREGCVLDEENYFTLDLPDQMSDASIIEQIISSDVEQIAAIIVEPIIGSGGIYVFSAEFLQKLRDFTIQNNILLIFDEVVTGFGRTGSLFAYQELGVIPDILVLAKGITAGYAPLGVTVFTSKVTEPFKGDKKFLHGYTNAGSVVGIAAAQAVLDIFENENILENVNIQSNKIFKKLSMLKEKYPRSIKSIRGKGLMIGIQLVEQSQEGCELDYFYQLLEKEHIISRSAYQNVVVLMPPLTSDDQFITDLLERIERVVDQYGEKYEK
ncbi:aminotransferase family protein [Enterococcus sp. DIV1420a]|uniref:aminotransferase family protein n=1 Tax=Enterococcus sp. DIV1420a TaxID=2774672 RepID=UPI003F26F1DB